jgi:hypothetical protein
MDMMEGRTYLSATRPLAPTVPTILLDIHVMKDYQNGFDSSGQAMGFKWTTAMKNEFTTYITF